MLADDLGRPVAFALALDDHRAILACLDQRDAVGARKAMHDHLLHVERVLAAADELASAGESRPA